MFYSITGDIVMRDSSSVALNCQGVAFRCFVSGVTLSRLVDVRTATLYTYLSVKEDALDLFGFYDEEELEFFKYLISVNGVGPKMALAVLSSLTVPSLVSAIVNDDVKSLTLAPGVGPKLAHRISLELKGKMKDYTLIDTSDESGFSSVSTPAVNSNTREAVEALVSLGFRQAEASAAVAKCDPNLKVEKLITEALKHLS